MGCAEPADHNNPVQHCLRRAGRPFDRWLAFVFVLHGGQHNLDLFLHLHQQYSQYFCGEQPGVRQGLFPAADHPDQPGADQPHQLFDPVCYVRALLGRVCGHRRQPAPDPLAHRGALRCAGGHAARPRRRDHRLLDYKLGKAWKVGLDYSFITGNNNYPFVANAVAGSLKDKLTQDNAKGITYHEIAPSITYKVGKVSATAYYGRNLGDVNYGKGRVEIRYDF